MHDKSRILEIRLRRLAITRINFPRLSLRVGWVFVVECVAEITTVVEMRADGSNSREWRNRQK